MNKPEEIIELERIYGIRLNEGKPDANRKVKRNAYAINESGAVTHLNLSGNQLSEMLRPFARRSLRTTSG
jgi:hypothetical protein